MFGFFKRKALKKRAFNLYKELVFGRLYEGNRFGLNAKQQGLIYSRPSI